jgi:riboflavin synthase
VSFDLMQETLKLTNLGLLKVGDKVNVERAAKFGDEIGGHAMSGHIMNTAEVTRVIESPNNRQVWFQIAPELTKYVFTKGYIGIDGISLTIGEVKGDQFCVNLIPETLERTILSERVAGDLINIEIDPQTQTIVDTVERVMAQRAGQ